MPTTTYYGWPTPSSGDDPDVPTDMKALADAVDLSLQSYMLTGAKIMATTPGSVVTVAMTNVSTIIFPMATFDGPFAVAMNYNSAASSTSSVVFRCWSVVDGLPFPNGTSVPFYWMIRVIPVAGLVPTSS